MRRLLSRHQQVLVSILLVLSIVTFLLQLNLIFNIHIVSTQIFFLLFFSGMNALFIYLRFIDFQPMAINCKFLVSTFFLITAWRLSALAGFHIIAFMYAVAFILVVANFFTIAFIDLHQSRPEHSVFEWQLLFVRLYIGYDLIPHFCEKLFAGSVLRAHDVMAFAKMGLPHPGAFVVLAGLCELAGAFAVSCGLFLRFSSLCLFAYLMMATILGHHFSLGFIWATPGGGWEFPVFWAVMVLCFCLFGSKSVSIDEVLGSRHRRLA